MTTDSRTPARNDASQGSEPLAAKRQDESLWHFLSRERHWLVLLVPYLFSWIVPFFLLNWLFRGTSSAPAQGALVEGILYWCGARWFASNSATAFQPFVPIAVGLLVWAQREKLQTEWRRLAQRHSSPTHPKRHGNPIIFLIGCAALIFAYCVQVKGVAVGAQLIIAVGTIYWVFGPVILRILAPTLALLVLMIPPPDTALQKLADKGAHFAAQGASFLLQHSVPGRGVYLTGGKEADVWFLHIDGGAFQVSPFLCDGTGPMVCAMMFFFWYSLYRKIHPISAILLMAFSAGLALLLNILRIAVAALAYNSAQGVTSQLIGIFFFNRYILGWLITAAACLLGYQLTLLVHRAAAGIPGPMRSATVRLGLGMDAAAKPIDAALSFSGRRIGSLWTRSERGLEGLLKRLFPRRRRSRHSGRSGRR